MDFLREWILGITAAAILGAAASAIAPKGTGQRAVKLCTALILSFAILRPLAGMRELNFPFSLPQNADISEEVLSVGRELTARIIEEQSAAYIVSKAQAVGLVVTARITCKDGEYSPEPYAVTVRCERPLHAQNALEEYIRDELGIPPERQSYAKPQ